MQNNAPNPDVLDNDIPIGVELPPNAFTASYKVLIDISCYKIAQETPICTIIFGDG